MAGTNPNTILLKPNGGDYDERPVEEALAGGTITPGMLILFSSGNVIANGTAADADAPAMWALEKEFLDPNVVTDPPIDVTYTSGQTVRYIWSQPGDKLYALLEAGANVARGAPLESNGAGALQAYSNGKIIAFADEAKDNSVGGSAVRIKVRAA